MKRGFTAIGLAVLAVSTALAQQKKTVTPPPKPEDKAQAAGGTRFAILNLQQAVFGSKEGKERADALSKEFAPRQADLKAQSDALAALKSAQGNSDEVAAKQRDLDAAVKAWQEDGQAKQKAVFQEVLNKMAPIIMKYSEAHGFGMVLDGSQPWPQSNLLWAGPSADITKAVIEAYDAATQCDALDKGVQIDDARPTGSGHCAGESDFWFTNTSAHAIDCAIIFHKNGRFDPTSVLTFTLAPGEKSGGTGKISTCGADSGEMQYQCFAHSEYVSANSCLGQIQWK
jgi:Skp family chaperone for outer membrane proteins